MMGRDVNGEFVAYTADGGVKDPNDRAYHYEFQKGDTLANNPNFFRDAKGRKTPVTFIPKGQPGDKEEKFNSPHPFKNRRDPSGENPRGIPRDPFGSSLRIDKNRPRRFYFNFLERVTDNVGRNIHNIAGHKAWLTMSKPFWKLVGIDESKHEQMAKDAALAAMPYASYFTAKVFWRGSVNDQMRLAVGRMLDGAMQFKISEVREGLSEIGKTLQGLPLSNPDRQALLIQKRTDNPSDKSPMPSNWTQGLHKKYLNHIAKNGRMKTSDLAYIAAERRADYYKEKAKNIRHAQSEPITDEMAEPFIKVDPGYDRLESKENTREAILKKYKAEHPTPAKRKNAALKPIKSDSWQERKTQEPAESSLAPAA
jgi:hypothetical protein